MADVLYFGVMALATSLAAFLCLFRTDDVQENMARFAEHRLMGALLLVKEKKFYTSRYFGALVKITGAGFVLVTGFILYVVIMLAKTRITRVN